MIRGHQCASFSENRTSSKNLVPELGPKRGSNRAPKQLFRHYLKKASFVFPDFLHVIRGHQCASFSENRTSSKNLVSELGPKRGSNRALKGPLRHYLKKSVSHFPDFLHVNRGYQCASFGENRMSGKNLVGELWPKKLSANQRARFLKMDFL